MDGCQAPRSSLGNDCIPASHRRPECQPEPRDKITAVCLLRIRRRLQITPAPSNPSANTPLEPIFPQSNTPAADRAGARSHERRDADGPGIGSWAGYGPIRPGDIVEVHIFDAPEYSVSMPVSPAGQIAIPYAGLFRIEGMTSIEAAQAIAQPLCARTRSCAIPA